MLHSWFGQIRGEPQRCEEAPCEVGRGSKEEMIFELETWLDQT